MTHSITHAPIHQSELSEEDWQERLRTDNPVGAVNRLLAAREEREEAAQQR